MPPAHPFLKWAGGKAQLAEVILGVFPTRAESYFEPFLGGGAMFFATMLRRPDLRTIVLGDANWELIDCYKVVRDFPEELIGALQYREDGYNSAPDPKAFYEHWKAQDPRELDPITRASRTILLNKTGFNGLFRTNLEGKFNVPWSKKKTARIFDEDNIRACSTALQPVQLRAGDFTKAVREARAGDIVYFDPPYLPVSKTANFTSYTEARFTVDDQYRLLALFRELVDKGVKVILSNADLPEVRSMYAGFEIQAIKARRVINSKGSQRGPVGEVLIIGRPDLRLPEMETGASVLQPPVTGGDGSGESDAGS